MGHTTGELIDMAEKEYGEFRWIFVHWSPWGDATQVYTPEILDNKLRSIDGQIKRLQEEEDRFIWLSEKL